jgi:hypothetical protein
MGGIPGRIDTSLFSQRRLCGTPRTRLADIPHSSVIFDLPGFTTAASGAQQNSLDALRKASATSYYKDKDSLWVKVVSNGDGARIAGPGAGGTSVQVSR